MPQPNANQFYTSPEPTGVDTSNSGVTAAATLQTLNFSTSVNNLGSQYTRYSVTVNRVVPGGQLDTPEGTQETLASGTINDRYIEINDDHTSYGDYSVHLYTITLT